MEGLNDNNVSAGSTTHSTANPFMDALGHTQNLLTQTQFNPCPFQPEIG